MGHDGMTRGRFLAGAAAAGAATVAAPLLTGPAAAAAPRPAGGEGPTDGGQESSRRGLTYRGVLYECADGETPHTGWDRNRMCSDVRAIRRSLHANSLVAYGTGVERLTATAAEAAEHGMHVWLQPRLADVPEREILDHLAETGRQAERLRRQGARVYLSVGCEFVLFVPGIAPGDNAYERVRNMLSGNWDPEEAQRKLDRLIPRAAATARAVFHGPVTYGAALGDTVGWTLFDIVSVNYYSYFADPGGYARELAPYCEWGRPVAITECGTCTFQGAPEAGGMGWDTVDHTKPKPEVRPGLRRSERTQARYLTQVLDVFEDLGLHAAMVYEFVSPDQPHRGEPRYDYDMAGYTLTKAVWGTEDDPTARWHWEPKESFHAVARHFARAAARSGPTG
ncbi:abortive phage infection protein [Streptomyces longispororuber]|nr:abortive phage infection protein [Streptomyces longispororuber]